MFNSITHAEKSKRRGPDYAVHLRMTACIDLVCYHSYYQSCTDANLAGTSWLALSAKGRVDYQAALVFNSIQ